MMLDKHLSGFFLTYLMVHLQMNKSSHFPRTIEPQQQMEYRESNANWLI